MRGCKPQWLWLSVLVCWSTSENKIRNEIVSKLDEQGALIHSGWPDYVVEHSKKTWILWDMDSNKETWIADSNKKILRFGLLFANISKTSSRYELDAVDGRHPAPPDTCETPWIWDYFTYELVSRISEPSTVVWRVSRYPYFCWWIIFQGELVIVLLKTWVNLKHWTWRGGGENYHLSHERNPALLSMSHPGC